MTSVGKISFFLLVGGPLGKNRICSMFIIILIWNYQLSIINFLVIGQNVIYISLVFYVLHQDNVENIHSFNYNRIVLLIDQKIDVLTICLMQTFIFLIQRIVSLICSWYIYNYLVLLLGV